MPIYSIKDNKGKTIKYRVDVNYKDENGNYKRITKMNKNTTTLSGAKKVELEILNKLNLMSSDLSSDEMTYQQLWESYCEYQKNEVKQTTLKKCEQHNRVHILPFFKDKIITKITHKDVQRWKNKMNEKDLNVTTKNNIFKSLKCVMNYGVKFHNLTSNVCYKVSNFKNPTIIIDEEVHYWTIDEFNKFIYDFRSVCEEKNDIHFWNYYVLFNVLYFAGLRRGEAYALRWTDYDSLKRTLHIKKSICQKLKGVRNFETSPKTKSSIRKIKIPKRLCDVLDEHLKRYEEDVYLFDKKSDIWYINGGLEPLRDTTVDKYFNAQTEKLDLEQIRIHDLRHSFASLLINGGVNIKIISEMMGHSSVDITWNRYGHLYPNAQDKATDYIDSL